MSVSRKNVVARFFVFSQSKLMPQFVSAIIFSNRKRRVYDRANDCLVI